jgi:hypothetical protein
MCPDNVRQSGDSDVATNFYSWSFSRTALDQGSENGGTCCVGSSGKQAKVISANHRSEEGSTSEKKLRPLDMTKADIYQFIAKQKLGVLGTLSSGGSPQSALVGIAFTPELEIIFDTVKNSRKFSEAGSRTSRANASAAEAFAPCATSFKRSRNTSAKTTRAHARSNGSRAQIPLFGR